MGVLVALWGVHGPEEGSVTSAGAVVSLGDVVSVALGGWSVAGGVCEGFMAPGMVWGPLGQHTAVGGEG